MAEIAGLVLAVVPLLISAVEDYQNCFQVLDCWRHFRKEYRACDNRIKQIDLEYELLIEKLLGDAYDDAELLSLKMKPAGTEWADADARLRQRLQPRIYEVFVATIRGMREKVTDLAVELGCNEADFQKRIAGDDGVGEVVQLSSGDQHRRARWYATVRAHIQDSSTRASYEARKLKFSLGRERRNSLFDSIDRCIATLDRLLLKNDEITTRPRSKANKALLEFWRHAHNLFRLLDRSWTCVCRRSHSADLLLLHRIHLIAVHFELSFHHGPVNDPSIASPWTCHAVSISERKSDVPRITPQASGVVGRRDSRNPTPPRALVRPTNLPRRRRPRPGTVSFQSTSGPAAAPTHLSGSLAKEQKILNLCDTLSACRTQECNGFLAATEIEAEFTMITGPRSSSQQSESTCLRALLADPKTQPARKQRYSMAVAIASSHLQLHSSAWLQRRWSADDIVFDIKRGAAQLDRPLLRAGFAFDDQGTNLSDRDDTFVSLGIVLLELCFGKNLDDCEYRGEYRSSSGQPNFVMDQCLARRWAEDVEDETGPDYAEAVLWCLMKKPRDNTWRPQFHAEVVDRLERVCSNF